MARNDEGQKGGQQGGGGKATQEGGVGVARVIEISARSARSFEDAIQIGITRVNKTMRNVTSAWVKDHMSGLDPTPCFESTCFVALSKNANKELIIDFAPRFVPNHENIVIYATGWAGKFVPLIGKILSDLTLTGRTEYDIPACEAP